MNRCIAYVFALILALGIPVIAIGSEEAENAEYNFLTVSVAIADGEPAVSVHKNDATLVFKSMTFVTGPSKTQVTLTPVDGEIELRTSNLIIRGAKIRFSTTDLEIGTTVLKKIQLPMLGR